MDFLKLPEPVQHTELSDREDTCGNKSVHDGGIPNTSQWDVVCLIYAKLDLVLVTKLPEKTEPRVLSQFAKLVVVPLEYIIAQPNIHHKGLVGLEKECCRGSIHTPVLTKVVDACT